MGYGDFSAFNPEIRSTANLDALVQGGVTLANCYASSPVCAPARASILTGRYPQRGGVIDTLEARGYDRLKVSETTMADVFKGSGYSTALIGKWHLGAVGDEYHPNKRGFDYFFGFRGGWNYYYDYIVERNGTRVRNEGRYLTDLFSDEAVGYVRDNADRPFFLHLAYNAPHFPFEAPSELVGKYLAMNKYTPAVCRIYAMIERMDIGLGRVLAQLEISGIAENTIVIFASDNGPDFGGSGEDSLVRFNCGLRGSKMLAYEGGIRVPAVVRWPSKLPAGSVSEEIIHGIDWLPTLCAMCGLESRGANKMDGIDVSAALHVGSLGDRRLYWQWNRHQPDLGGNAAIRDGKWKLLHAPVTEYLELPPDEIEMDVDIKSHPENYREISRKAIPERKKIGAPIVEMYDISADASESMNLAAVEANRVRDMEGGLKAWFDEVEAERLSN